MDYAAHLTLLMMCYWVAAESLNVLAGFAGLMCLSHGAFMALGAYTVALLTVGGYTSFGVALVVAAFGTAACASLVAVQAVRLRGDEFVLVSFCIQHLIVTTLTNWSSVTGGPRGVFGIGRPVVLGHSVNSPIAMLCLYALVCLGVLLVIRRLLTGYAGRLLRGTQADEILMLSYGHDVTHLRAQAFVASAVGAAIAGGMLAVLLGYIEPSSFGLSESILLLVMVIVGGRGHFGAGLIGGSVVLLVPECLRLMGFPHQVAANIRQVLYGALLVGTVFWYPAGLRGFVGVRMVRGYGGS